MKGIEFVCLGNNGRSPVAEVVAKDYVRKIGADIPIYSSGILVDNMEFSPKTLQAMKSVGIDCADSKEISNKVWEIEIKFRTQALKQRDYDSLENHIRKQTNPKKDVDLMLAVDNRVKELLLNMQTMAKVYTIAEYATAELYEPELKPWFTDARMHVVYLDALVKVVPKAIDRYIQEFSV